MYSFASNSLEKLPTFMKVPIVKMIENCHPIKSHVSESSIDRLGAVFYILVKHGPDNKSREAAF